MAANPALNLNPGTIFGMVNAYQRTVALKGALDLDLFTQIADGATSVPALASRLKASEKGVRILCDFLTIMGLLTKNQDAYGLSPEAAAFLNKRSPSYIGSIVNFQAGEVLLERFTDVAAVVRKGGTIHDDVATEVENPLWIEFARSMAPMAAIAAQGLAKLVADPGRPMKVLDIAASHGLFGIHVALLNPSAQIVALDWANVLPLAVENAGKMGVAVRYSTLPGSVFDIDLGSGYDLALVTNFMHMFDRPTIVKLLKKLRAAIKPGGRIATVEFIPNDDRVTPPEAGAFSFNMLNATTGGDAYTFREYDQMFREAGFGESRQSPLGPSPQQAIVTQA